MDNPSSDQLRVLVVDDDELNQRMMRLILTREGHHVHIACDGIDALQKVRDHEFDIILMDLQMPVMDGVETSRKIREHEDGGKNAYIVALTASYLPEKGQELFEAGIDNYIAKPFDVAHLRQMLDYGLDHRKSRRHSATTSEGASSEGGLLMSIDVKAGIVLVGGDEEIYRELLADFVEKLPGKNEKIEQAFAEKDRDGLSRLAHNIKGVSSNLGALQLNEYAGRLEKHASEGYTFDALEGIVREFRDISQKFIEEASNFLALP
jgi:CheY-like chemotaxis protein/HPt (histidine-containing phosphotransfer) domain-containing protein